MAASRKEKTTARLDRKKYLLWGLVVLLALGVFGATLALSEPAPPHSVVLATGAPRGAYFEFGKKIAALLKDTHALHVEVRETLGSVENLNLLLEGKADVAFIQGGIISSMAGTIDLMRLRAIARVYSEPLWVFYQGDEEIGLLKDFKAGPSSPKKRIAVGPDGSGTQVIALELLRVNGIREENAIFVESSTQEAVEAFARGEVDVLFLVASPEAESVQTMLHTPGARLMNFANHGAYARRLPYLTSLDIDQGLLSLEENLPEKGLVLLAPSATLIVRADTHPRVVELFTKAATRIFGEGNLIDLAGEFPVSTGLEIPQHEAARRYMTEGESWLSRNLPFWAVRLLSRLKLFLIPLVTVLLPAIKILPFLIQLSIYQRIKKRYEALRDIEGRIRRAKSPREVQKQLEELRHLHNQFGKVASRYAGAYQEKIYHFKLHLRLVQVEGRERLAQLEKGEAGPEMEQERSSSGDVL